MVSNTITQYHVDFYRDLQTVHRALKRGLQSIVDNAPLVLPKDQSAFIRYCQAFSAFLHGHHHHEDEIMFPMLAGPCGVEEEVRKLDADHDELIALLKTFEDQVSAQAFDGKAISRAATALNNKLCSHLHYEESVFVPAVLARASAQLIEETLNRIKTEAKKGNPFLVLPFFVKNMTKAEAHYMVFDGEPWIFRKVLYPALFSKVNKRSWAFASKPTVGTAASAA